MKKIYSIPVFLLLFACGSVDRAQEERVISALLKQEQKAHLQKDADLFVSEFADSMIAVNRGNVSVSTREQHLERIGHYFNSVQFVAWEDVADPVIRFSDDARLAYAIIQKRVVLVQKDDATSKPDTTDFAWVSILRKHDGQWKVECNVSTNKE